MGGERAGKSVASVRVRGGWMFFLVFLVGAAAEANSVTVKGGAVLGRSGFQLVVTLEDPASVEPNDAWVGIGPDKGMAEETQVVGRVVIDPAALRMAPSSPSTPNHLCFLGLSETSDWATAKVILVLERGPGRSWLIGARIWDDALASYVAVGPSVLTEAVPTTSRSPRAPRETGPGPSAMGVEFEWRVASAPDGEDGVFRLFRTVDGSRELLLESAAVANGTQTLNYLRAGVVNGAHQARDTFGTLFLDDVGLSRTFDPVAP